MVFEAERLANDRALRQAQAERKSIQDAVNAERAAGRTVDAGTPGALDQANTDATRAQARVQAFQKEAAAIESVVQSARDLADAQTVLTARTEVFQTFADGLGNGLATLALDADNAADAFKKLGLDIPGILVNRTIRAFIDGFGGQSGFAGVSNFFGGLFGREFGGPLYSGQTALVGENGPELISPARSVRVTPIDRATMGPGLAPNITFNIAPGNLTPTEVAHAIEMRLQHYTGKISASRRMNQRMQ